jgi:multidrug efflux pump subunit AcrA (membrane-fusion protein)
MATWVRSLGCLLFIATLAGCEDVPAVDQVKAPKDGKPAKPAPEAAKHVPAKGPTHRVEKGPLKVEVDLKGVVEAVDTAEVALRPEAWSPHTGGQLIVLRAVEHGTPAKKGDPIVWLDLEKISRAIRDLEADSRLAELAIKQAEEELPVAEKSTPLEAAQAERARKQADEDLKRFLEIDKALTEKMANFIVKSASQQLEYAKEELRQLEKMYRAGDIREETEEIILKRQRNEVEQAAFYLHFSEVQRDRQLQVRLPRQEQELKDGAERTALALDRARSGLPLALKQRHLALQKLRYEHAKSAEQLKKLRRDREAMTVKAPADGIVYYGKCTRGQWSTAAMMATKLLRGGMLMPDEVLLTIVQPRPVFVRAAVEEKDLHHLHAGLQGKLVPVADPDRKLAARVAEVSPIPISPRTFEARVTMEAGKDDPALVPGMACTVKLLPYVKPDALTVPAKAVFPDELDDDKHFVYLPAKDGKPEKRSVRLGKTAGDSVEVLSGLQEGDEILLEKPKADKKAPAK